MMPISNRRTFLQVAIGGVAGLTLRRSLSAQSAARIASTSLDANLNLLTGAGANVLAMTGADGTLLVDGGLSENSAALLSAVAALPGAGKVTTLFNTNWHPEHTGSNLTLGNAGATIIAHENTRLWLTQNVTWPWNGKTIKKLPKIAQPNKTFYDSGKLDSGIRYGYISDAAHTDGDIYVYFSTQNVLAVGGAVSGQGWAELDWWTGGWIGGMVGGLQRLQTVADAKTRIVPARGPILSLADLKTQLDMYGKLYDSLNGMLNKGKGLSEAVEAKPAKEFEDKMGNSDEFVRRAFESLWAYATPDA